jgi:hypothetical protein
MISNGRTHLFVTIISLAFTKKEGINDDTNLEDDDRKKYTKTLVINSKP